MTSPTDSPTPPRPGSKWDDSEFHQAGKSGWMRRHPRESLFFATLGVITLAVIVWLPGFISPVSVPPDQSPATAQQSTGKPASGSAGSALESPWEEAQLTRARRQAQEILAKLLDRQSRLEKMNVNLWAADDFARALATAASGDEQYRLRDFNRAQDSYQTALAQMDALVESAAQVAQQALQSGVESIRQQDAAAAQQQFRLALAIDADSNDGQQGLERAQVLDRVVEKLDSASNLALQGDLDAALQQTGAALQLDPHSDAAQQQQQDLQQQIRERDYAAAMGAGLQQLQSGRYAQAAASFRRALDIKPADADARAALSDTGQRELQSRIQSTLERAATLEQGEQWREAQQAYEQVQALDNSLVSARVGALRSRARADLDERLQKLIDEPLRLSDEQVLQDAAGLLRNARKVRPRGERIAKQAQQLAQAIQQSQLPVTVQLRSDNRTRVTLYRVGTLGTFNQHELDLIPGRYTLVGNRQGYRDVREEFTVQPGREPVTIVIQCTEKISLDG